MSLKILIVEDNNDSRTLLHYLFTTRGFEVSTATDGMEGVYMARAEKPALIITDLTMPNMDGIEMIRQLRAEPETADIPMVIYTAFGSAEITQSAAEVGAARLFAKPFDLDALMEFAAAMSQSDQAK